MPRLLIHHHRLAPYHVVRDAHAHARLAEDGIEVGTLETAGTDGANPWRVPGTPSPFGQHVVFPGEAFEQVGPHRMHRGITAALDRFNPAAVAITAYGLPDARACLAWCRRHGRAALLMAETTAHDAPRRPLQERVKAALIAQFDAALAGGTAHADYLVALGFPADRIHFGYDVVDNDFYAAVADAKPDAGDLPGVGGGAPYFLASARLIARKNVDGLVRAYAAYRAASPAPWRLVVVGDGPERAGLEALVAALGVGGVTFAGARQIEDVARYLAHASAFVHPAHTEAWGLVVNEALAAGLPVVVARTAGCAPDLVREGENGWLVDPSDDAALAEALARVAALAPDARAAMGAAGRRVIADWHPRRFGEGMAAALASATPERTRRPLSPVAAALVYGLALLPTLRPPRS